MKDLRFRRTAAGPEEWMSLNQMRQRVKSALAELTPDQRQALELSFFSGLSHSELAEHLGRPLGTVKTHIRLGMMKMRLFLRINRESGHAWVSRDHYRQSS
jgi:RNA polymerase sigma factor (sigma-70 family)